MKKVIEVYDLVLKVDGPIYIGSGNEIAKKEYALIEREHTVAVMDPRKLYQLLEKKRLTEKYLSFMLGTSREDVGRWLSKNQVKTQEYQGCIKYKLDYGNAQIDTHSKLNILEFMKDAYGLPYIPGSSMKGMLRTVLLADELMRNKENYSYLTEKVYRANTERVSRTNLLAQEAAEMEETFYNTLNRLEKRKSDAVNDIMAGFIVSDSEPLSISDLVLCQRIEYHVDGREKKMNVLREVLRPGTLVHFKLSIDTSLCGITKEQIEKAIENFGKMYYNVFLQKFSVIKQPEKNAVWLGGGCGFITKTEMYPLLGETTALRKTVEVFNALRVPLNHKHNADHRLGVSPHICKMTYYNNKRCQMGLGRLKISKKI